MAKKVSYATIESEIGFRPSKHPNEDYLKSAEVVWCVLRNSVPEKAEPKYVGDRMGFNISMGVVQAIRQIWDLADKDVNSARGQIVKYLKARTAALLISPGRGKNVQPEWWVADTFEKPEDGAQGEEITLPKTPTDWKDAPAAPPEHNGKEVPTLPLIEQSVPGDSLDDRLDKAFDMIREVVAEVREQAANDRAENAVLRSKVETIERAVRAISD